MGFSVNKSEILLLILAILVLNLHLSTSSPSSTEFSGDFFPIEPKCRGGSTMDDECSSVSDGVGAASAAVNEEFEMESEIGGRMLAEATRYISYGALRRNSVPCSRRGASYYNCRRGAEANPYSRGCSAITRCRR